MEGRILRIPTPRLSDSCDLKETEEVATLCRQFAHLPSLSRPPTLPPPPPQGLTGKLSGYCPLDLFSGDFDRIQNVVLRLLDTPQNNLRVFFGVLVTGTHCRVTTHPYFALPL